MGSLRGFSWLSGANRSTIVAWRRDGANDAGNVGFDVLNDENDEHPKEDAEKLVARVVREGRADSAENQLPDAEDAAERAQAEGEKVTAKQLLDAYWEAWGDRALSELAEIRAGREKARREEED